MSQRLRVWFVVVALTACVMQTGAAEIFSKQQFSDQDAVLVSDQNGQIIYSWQADKLLVPASLTKLLTSYLAIDKWGLSHQFKTDFYRVGTQLWVKGYGDPYLVSEEIDLIANALNKQLNKLEISDVESIHIDASYFSSVMVPGRSSVVDPYNAPLSAVGANFNTAYLQRTANRLESAESQTPLTPTASKIVDNNNKLVSAGNKTRINLINRDNAQRNFAELLAVKLGVPTTSIHINAELPELAQRLYRHENSHSLQSVLTGAMKYSNNFISNQVFLKLAETSNTETLNFEQAQTYIAQTIKNEFSWQSADIEEGAGLSRNNKLTAHQIDELLVLLKSHKTIFKEVISPKNSKQQAQVFAKTGTLNGVSNYAGYIDLPSQEYRFVFLFNRSVPYGYRDRLLEQLIQELSVLETK